MEVAFGKVRAVAGANLRVEGDELVALLGPSGCGKTTLLRCIAGFERAASGRITLDGAVIESHELSMPAHKRQIGMVFQDYALFPHMTVGANISYGLGRGEEARRRVGELLDLGGLAGLDDRYPHQLSGGQQQRVAVLRSLAPRPRLLLLDEPFSNLDPALRLEMREQVSAILRSEGMPAILVTHDRADAFSVADRIAVMEAGRIFTSGTPESLYFRPESPAAARFAGEVQYLDGTASDGKVQTALGLSDASGPAEDGPCRALVRPEWIVADADSPIRGTVVSRRLEGSSLRYRLVLQSGDEVAMLAGGGLEAREGQQVAVRVAVSLPTFTPGPGELGGAAGPDSSPSP